jgi:hypothetical protein
MKLFVQFIGSALLSLWAPLVLAVQPYMSGDKVQGGDLKNAMAQVEKKLAGAGFNVIGRHMPSGLAQHGSLVVTDQAMLDAVLATGGQTVVGAGIRVGVKADGSVSYMNPDYWYRAYLRKQFGPAEGNVKAVQDRLAKALGAGKPFGGEVPAEDLPSYRYMWGMERFDDFKNELRVFAGFDEAVKTIRDNLARQVGNSVKVYEIVAADKKLAVFGVAMNDPKTGEGWWVNKVGPDHIAALPWEIYVVGNKAGALQGRYRTALAWPSLTMGTFMGISDHPNATHDTLRTVVGGVKD